MIFRNHPHSHQGLQLANESVSNKPSPGAIKILLGILFLATLTGCVGYVDGGGGGGVLVAPPPVIFWGGPYEGRGDWHGYSHRGFESRGRH